MKRVDLWEPIRHRLWCYVWHQWHQGAWADRRPFGVDFISCRECGEVWHPKESRKHKEVQS